MSEIATKQKNEIEVEGCAGTLPLNELDKLVVSATDELLASAGMILASVGVAGREEDLTE